MSDRAVICRTLKTICSCDFPGAQLTGGVPQVHEIPLYFQYYY